MKQDDVADDVHNRMPEILRPEYESARLDPDTSPERALAMLRPYPNKAMKKYVVSRLVNSPANDKPEVIKPVQKPARNKAI